MHMGIHPAFFTITVVGWIFAALGVVTNDANARDWGLLIAVGSMGIGLLVESETVRGWIAGRGAKARVPAENPVARMGVEPIVPEPTTAPTPEVVRPPVASLARTSPGWEAEFVVAKPSEPMVVAPSAPANGHSNGHGAGPERLTRGVCGKCQSPITVSSRRPIRVTCPVCGHSKLLQ